MGRWSNNYKWEGAIALMLPAIVKKYSATLDVGGAIALRVAANMGRSPADADGFLAIALQFDPNCLQTAS